jgi:site-specific DNA recombinase
VADGQIQAVLVLSPDRLSRKYAYQVLLTEEWLRHGVQTIFIKAPQSQTPEDQLLLQFQGMIAEYERAQILERSRRGKRHRAKQGQVSVLSGPDGHFKFPHLWPPKLPQAGRGGLWVSGPCLTWLFWTPSLAAVWQAKRVRP